MTSLLAWLRESFGHRHDPPPMLPDPVTWTTDIPLGVSFPDWLSEQTAEGWTLVKGSMEDNPTTGLIRVTFRREDGAYRWRDDGFVGF